MFEPLIQYYYDYFMDDKNDGWLLIRSTVCVMVLSELYKTFVDNGEVPPIEELLIEEKKRFWEVVVKVYNNHSKEEQVRAVKAAYVLSLITSN